MKKITIISLLFVSIFTIGSTRNHINANNNKINYEQVNTIDISNSYNDYREDEPMRPNNEYYLDYNNLVFGDSFGYELIDELDGELDVVYSSDESKLTFNFYNDHAGYYNIQVRYYPIEGKSGSIERNILVNGDSPFDMAEQITFPRIWVNETNDFITDQNNNDIIPKQIEKPRWNEKDVYDRNGYYETSLLFYFDAGNNTLSFESVREPMVVDYIKIYQNNQTVSYENYSNIDQTSKTPSDFSLTIEGEHMYEKSSPTLYPITDRTSPITSPQHYAELKLNAAGGINYRQVGDFISYQIDVPEDGYYNLSLRYKQTYLRGAYVSRKILIDNKILFDELANVQFEYTNWDIKTLGNEQGAYNLFLEKGTHTVSFEVILGDFTESIREIETVIDNLNQLYRQIIMITSTTPDVYRDYQLTEKLPTMIETFEQELETINQIVDTLYEVTGESSDKTVALNQIAIQLQGFIEKPHTIHQRLGEFRNNVSALGTWILNIKEQPLAIDYLILHSSDATLPKAKANFFQNVWFEFRSFIASFYIDYNSLSSTSGDEQTDNITVWIGTGRDQANVVRRLIDESFTPETGIGVDLELVNGGVLLPATFTGKGPDIMLGAGNTTPVNYAMRNAVYDLTNFDDFDIVMSEFKESAITPYRYEGGVYALPEQQVFPVMFYRTDIMTEIGIIPEDADAEFWDNFTWDDVIDMIPELQRLNLEFYLPIDIVEQQLGGIIPPNIIYMSLLYQNGGELYSEDSTHSLLQEKVAVETFKEWSSFYTNYRFSIQANFVNRFRTGEMPIGIAYYSAYNTLSVFAPEISGDWTFVPIPGTRQADGSVDHTTTSTGTGAIIMNNSDEKDLSWEFLKWWGSEDTQVKFGREMEGILGAAARYPTANVKALEKLPWPSKDINTLLTQWDSVKGIQEIPGSYVTGRYLDYSLRNVINTGANPRETLYEYAELINDEITNKRKEFDLD